MSALDTIPAQSTNELPSAVTAASAPGRYADAKSLYRAGTTNVAAAWQLARACYDMALFATNRAQRAELANEGIAVSQHAVVLNSNSAPAQYYLGMNLAQLARTKGLGALKLVRQMEQIFLRVSLLDDHFDYAGPDRNLGLLYRDAPALGSIGSRTKARQHLLRAAELTPDYPENRLNLIETLVKWNEPDQARRELQTLQQRWSTAQTNLPGPAWAQNWTRWQERMDQALKTLAEKK